MTSIGERIREARWALARLWLARRLIMLAAGLFFFLAPVSAGYGLYRLLGDPSGPWAFFFVIVPTSGLFYAALWLGKRLAAVRWVEATEHDEELGAAQVRSWKKTLTTIDELIEEKSDEP